MEEDIKSDCWGATSREEEIKRHSVVPAEESVPRGDAHQKDVDQ